MAADDVSEDEGLEAEIQVHEAFEWRMGPRRWPRCQIK